MGNQKTTRIRKSNDEARKEAALKRNSEDQCRIGLMDHLESVLTTSETERLMNDIHKVEVKNLWEDRWRVNFWTRKGGGISFKYEIKTSFFFVWSDEFGLTNMNPDPKQVIRINFAKSKKDIFK